MSTVPLRLAAKTRIIFHNHKILSQIQDVKKYPFLQGVLDT
ncbi:hypothetical protein DA2_0804 [Desulfovibrio sp. A2]|nr:hypothetical protein DA2_0804 [Desulfovibrio sp. A2]